LYFQKRTRRRTLSSLRPSNQQQMRRVLPNRHRFYKHRHKFMRNKILLAFLVLSITGCMHAQTSNTGSSSSNADDIATFSAAKLYKLGETYSNDRQFPEA